MVKAMSFQDQLQYAVIRRDAKLLCSLLDTLPPGAIDDIRINFQEGTLQFPLLTAVIMTANPRDYIQPDFPRTFTPKKPLATPYTMVEMLLDRGANPNAFDALQDAIEINEEDIIIALLEHGADPNTRMDDEVNTPAFTYVFERIDYPDVDLIKAFLDAGVDIHHPNALLALVRTHFQERTEIDYPAIIDMLIKHGLTHEEIAAAYAESRGEIRQYIHDNYSPQERLTKL